LAEEREASAEMKLKEVRRAIEFEEVQDQLKRLMERHQEQAAIDQQLDAVRALHEEAAAAKHDEMVMRQAAWERQEQLAQQKEEEEAARMWRVGEKRKQDIALAELRRQSADERQSHAASSQEGQEGHAASSQSPPAAGHGVPTCSAELQAWLGRHELTGVYGHDRNGWSALHHVAQDSKSVAVEGIFKELCKHPWSLDQVNAPTGQTSEHLPQGWTALHLLANGPGLQHGQMVTRFLELKANPMLQTGRGATVLHTAAGTANHEVVRVLLASGLVDVNAQNKHNRTPYDMATSNRTTLQLIAQAGGAPSPNPTGAGRDEPNSRRRGAPASEARLKRAANWRSR
jgi:hypothetical protein